MERVFDGEHRPSLSSRMDQTEKDVAELTRIVKGEAEGEGLQYHMTEIRAGMRFLKWEIGLFAALVGVLATLVVKH